MGSKSTMEEDGDHDNTHLIRIGFCKEEDENTMNTVGF
jgi:hypothetical protein